MSDGSGANQEARIAGALFCLLIAGCAGVERAPSQEPPRTATIPAEPATEPPPPVVAEPPATQPPPPGVAAPPATPVPQAEPSAVEPPAPRATPAPPPPPPEPVRAPTPAAPPSAAAPPPPPHRDLRPRAWRAAPVSLVPPHRPNRRPPRRRHPHRLRRSRKWPQLRLRPSRPRGRWTWHLSKPDFVKPGRSA